MTSKFIRTGPLFYSKRFRDTKDPCPVFDGSRWHIFGSGGTSISEAWHILHATAPTVEGPWKEHEPVALAGLAGDHVAAPGVIYDEGTITFHMFVQTDFMDLGGTVEHLISIDGEVFVHADTSLISMPGTGEAGIYDPHPTIVGGVKYLSYSGTPVVEKYSGYSVARPDIYLAMSESGTWHGPWHRLGKILDHESIPHHNQHDHPDYEWGLEGSQLIELSGGRVLMNAVCFLPEGSRGERQRVFFAIADNVRGPYSTLGPVLTPSDNEWESGENGHAAGVMFGDNLYLFYQARSRAFGENCWRYGIATISLNVISDFTARVQKNHGLS